MSLNNQPSVSAFNVARCRAIAAHEFRDGIQGHDHLAEVFLDEPARQSLRSPVMHGMILKKLAEFSPGSYEYFIARTAYLDGVVEQALRDQIAQVVFLGAGYDTRALRFRDLLGHTRVFELDEPATQTHKQGLLAAAHITAPEQLTYIALDFIADSLLDQLTAAGYAPEKRTLFIWEGVTYYLPPRTVDATLAFIRAHAPAGSVVAFDYMLPQAQLAGRFGAERAHGAMQTLYTAEPLLFDLDEARVGAFLAERGFALLDHLTVEQMQTRYLTLTDGTSAGQMLDLFRLVQARVEG